MCMYALPLTTSLYLTPHQIVYNYFILFSSVQFSRSGMSNSLRPHESQHARPPCSSPTPGIYSDSCPSSWWCHPATSSSVVPFSSCPQSLPASWVNSSHAWGDQSIGVSASASVLWMNTQDWSPLGWIGWISLQSKGLSRVFSNTTVQKHQFFIRLIIFPLWFAVAIIFYFLSEYWLWKLVNIFYYCDYVTITWYHCIMIGQQKKIIEFYITKTTI